MRLFVVHFFPRCICRYRTNSTDQSEILQRFIGGLRSQASIVRRRIYSRPASLSMDVWKSRTISFFLPKYLLFGPSFPPPASSFCAPDFYLRLLIAQIPEDSCLGDASLHIGWNSTGFNPSLQCVHSSALSSKICGGWKTHRHNYRKYVFGVLNLSMLCAMVPTDIMSGPLAQLVEQSTLNRQVVGSIPMRPPENNEGPFGKISGRAFLFIIDG